MRVVVATRNPGKLAEIVKLLEGLPLELVPIDALRPDAELREDEETFEGNALAKARQASAATGLAAIADDSGLEVDALGGAPGVRSARYAAEDETTGQAGDAGDADWRNNAKLLTAMRDVPAGRRAARFRCVAAYVDPARAVEIVRAGSCAGEILTAPRGTGGFGYDPLFAVAGRTETMAELPLDEKNRLSHRAMAFRALADAMENLHTRRGSP